MRVSRSCPLSSALSSRMSLMRSSRCLPEPRICSTSSRASADRGPSTSVIRMSAKPRIALSGLRSSWLTAARNAARSRSAAAHAREVALVARLRGREAIDEGVERDGESPDLVHRPDRHGLAGRLRAHVDHAANALADELDVAVRVARDGIGDSGGDADQERGQRDQGTQERRGRLGRARLAHERDDHLRRARPSRRKRLGPEAGAPEPRDRFPRSLGRHTPERRAIRDTEARVERHLSVARHDDELGARLARRPLHRLQP